MPHGPFHSASGCLNFEVLAFALGYNVLHWTRSGMDYWAVSDLNQDELRQFSELFSR
jgi:anti-sigma factor RsiW